MPSYIQKTESVTLPVIVLHGTVAFPGMTVNFEPTPEEAAMVARLAGNGGSFIFLTTRREPMDSLLKETPFYTCGTVAKIKQLLRAPEGQTRIVAEGLFRAVGNQFETIDRHLQADLTVFHIAKVDEADVDGEAAVRALLRHITETANLVPTKTEDIIKTAKTYRDAGLLADFLATNLLVRTVDKQAVLESHDPIERAEILLGFLKEQTELLEAEAKIRSRVDRNMRRNQQEYYMREQLKVIQEELGDTSDIEEFAARIEQAKLPEHVAQKLRKENDRLSKVPFGSAEASVLVNYLDTCLDIPWTAQSKDTLRFDTVQKVLDKDHFGLEKVKERIVEYIAAKQLSPELRNQIICLVGPPGVGKTSIASSIARAMNREYVRISLGGVRDEADIRGHRKTYIGAMPGRIVTALTQAKVCNPLILLDEIDKLTHDAHGDPTSALLEVLDAEQNKSFRDHFVEIPIDLSNCVFIATANSLENIPRPLRDRMEIIELGIYTKREKLEIAKRYLIPKQLSRHGLSKKTLRLTDDALVEIIDYYTREAGVRNLERTIAALCRKVAKQVLEQEKKQITIKVGNIVTYLGARKLLPDLVSAENEVGVVNGLAYTELGGTLLKVEVAVLEGSGKIETTGSLGDVMKESAKLAVSYVRSIASAYGIPADFYKTKDIHIHFPEGAVPKDGPSAGVTMVTALVSALTGRAVRREVAMTGEISLRGNVLAIGGLKEKTMAAYNAGVETVLIPYENQRDLEELDPLARENMKIIPCRRIAEVLNFALVAHKPQRSESSVETIPTDTPPFLPVGAPAAERMHFE